MHTRSLSAAGSASALGARTVIVGHWCILGHEFQGGPLPLADGALFPPQCVPQPRPQDKLPAGSWNRPRRLGHWALFLRIKLELLLSLQLFQEFQPPLSLCNGETFLSPCPRPCQGKRWLEGFGVGEGVGGDNGKCWCGGGGAEACRVPCALFSAAVCLPCAVPLPPQPIPAKRHHMRLLT